MGMHRVNPARAGMIPEYLHEAENVDRKPRASGDDPKTVFSAVNDAE